MSSLCTRESGKVACKDIEDWKVSSEPNVFRSRFSSAILQASSQHRFCFCVFRHWSRNWLPPGNLLAGVKGSVLRLAPAGLSRLFFWLRILHFGTIMFLQGFPSGMLHWFFLSVAVNSWHTARDQNGFRNRYGASALPRTAGGAEARTSAPLFLPHKRLKALHP